MCTGRSSLNDDVKWSHERTQRWWSPWWWWYLFCDTIAIPSIFINVPRTSALDCCPFPMECRTAAGARIGAGIWHRDWTASIDTWDRLPVTIDHYRSAPWSDGRWRMALIIMAGGKRWHPEWHSLRQWSEVKTRTSPEWTPRPMTTRRMSLIIEGEAEENQASYKKLW